MPTEQALAERFGVSRISVREATRSLSFLGILQSAPKRGLTVGDVNMQRVTEYLSFHFALNNYSKTKLLQARIVIETGSLVYTMQQLNQEPSLYDQLMQIVDQHDRVDHADQCIELDIAFHRLLVEASGIDPLVAFTDLLQIFFQTFRKTIVQADRKKGNQGHRKIVKALRGRQLDEAQNVLRKHLEYYKGAL